jgi:hypothetical protein
VLDYWEKMAQAKKFESRTAAQLAILGTLRHWVERRKKATKKKA